MCTSTSVSRRSMIGARWFVAGFLGLTALTAGTTILVLGLAIAEHARSDERAPADAILVLGAAQYNGWPTRAFRARLDHAAALFRQGYAPTIVLVGGKNRPRPRE
jgi:vancomycin permeability regulator SanA